MGFWSGLVNGVIDGVQSQNGVGAHRIRQWCRELGWSPIPNGGKLFLPFTVDREEYMVAICEPDSDIPSLLCLSGLKAPPDQVPPNVFGFLLNRNSKIACMAWHVIEKTDGMASFAVRADVFIEGLNASGFRHLCTKMAEEVAAFDRLAQSDGRLR